MQENDVIGVSQHNVDPEYSITDVHIHLHQEKKLHNGKE